MKILSFPAIVAAMLCILSLGGCIALRPIDSSDDSTFRDTSSADPTVSDETESTEVPPLQPETETDAEKTTESVPVVEPIEESSVSFIGAGDNIIYYGNVRDAASCAMEGGRQYNFAPTYTSVAPLIQEADIAFINQETLMCGEGYAFSYYPRFNGPQDLAYDLLDAGFDVVNIANNHMLDKGDAGLAATIDFWNSLDGVTLLGGHKTEEDYRNIRILEKNGIKIALLSCTFETNGLVLPAESPLYIPYGEEEILDTLLAEANQIADFVILSVHWGTENVFTPSESQRTHAKRFAEGGADVIIGHHPHVIQPIEWIERENGERTLCVYSLGNFAAEMAHDYNMLGGLISFDIVKRGDAVTAENVEFIPTVYYYNIRFYQNHVYLLSDFTEDLAASHGLPYYGRTLSLSSIQKYLTDTISSEFLSDKSDE